MKAYEVLDSKIKAMAINLDVNPVVFRECIDNMNPSSKSFFYNYAGLVSGIRSGDSKILREKYHISDDVKLLELVNECANDFINSAYCLVLDTPCYSKPVNIRIGMLGYKLLSEKESRFQDLFLCYNRINAKKLVYILDDINCPYLSDYYGINDKGIAISEENIAIKYDQRVSHVKRVLKRYNGLLLGSYNEFFIDNTKFQELQLNKFSKLLDSVVEREISKYGSSQT